VLSAANICIAFLFQWYVFIRLGPGMETDALFAGMTIPQLVLAVVSGSLVHVLVPFFSGKSEDRLQHEVWEFVFFIGGLFSLLAIFLCILAPWWVPLTVPGFKETTQILTVELTRIQLIGMVFTAINGVQWAAYHARQQFRWAEFTPIVASAIAFPLLIWALPRFGVTAAAWITTLRMGLQTLLLASGMGRPMHPKRKSTDISEVWRRIRPLLLGAGYYKTDPLMDRFLLSMVDNGNLSLYYLAQQIYSAVSQMLNKAITAPLLPVLSRLHKAGDSEGVRRTYNHALLQMGILSLTGLLILGLFGQNLLAVLVGHGNVGTGNVYVLWWLMLWLVGMFIGGVMGQVSSSLFYASGDTTTLTRISMFTYTAYIPAKVVFFYYWNVTGLAIATSVYYITNLSLQVYLLKRKLICRIT
jgi:putative peptidoglycan lipid II flippase